MPVIIASNVRSKPAGANAPTETPRPHPAHKSKAHKTRCVDCGRINSGGLRCITCNRLFLSNQALAETAEVDRKLLHDVDVDHKTGTAIAKEIGISRVRTCTRIRNARRRDALRAARRETPASSGRPGGTNG